MDVGSHADVGVDGESIAICSFLQPLHVRSVARIVEEYRVPVVSPLYDVYGYPRQVESWFSWHPLVPPSQTKGIV